MARSIIEMAWLRFPVLAVVVGVTALLVTSSNVEAHHYVYIQENPDDRMRFSQEYDYNGNFSSWARGPYHTDWYDDGQFTASVTEAIRLWTTAVPELDFNRNSQSANLYFKKGMCAGIFTLACFVPWYVLPDDERQADYLFAARISIPAPQVMSAQGKIDTLLHEIGHWIGLDDQYYHTGAPCSNVQSVMNASFLSNGQNCLDIHAPTARDIEKVTEYWDNPVAMGIVEFTEYEDRMVSFRWDDRAWAEGLHTRGLWYKNSVTGDWVLVEGSYHYDDIGFHQDSIARTMQTEWDLDDLDAPTGGYYFIACVSAYSWPYSSWSPNNCAPQVWID